jgi:two-component system chemotaxis sensor kinase CheA
MDDLLADFLTETNENLAELDVALVTLERTPNDEATLSFIFRLVHTIKGTCGFLGLPRLERVAHAGENILGKIRDKALTVTPDIVSQVLASLDCIKSIVAHLGATGSEPAGDDADLIATLNATASGQIAASEPEKKAEPEAAAASTAPLATAPAVQAQTIRVTVDVLEDLMTLVSELVLTRNQLLQLARTQENAAFSVPLQRLSHITSDLQEGVMKTRMQPIGNAWNKLPRLVRDLSREMNKKIELTMLGADTELDRQVLEFIKDPLTHMVRNSGDHGLETPDERRAAGKAEAGRISLNAFHEGGYIIIEIADDGRGLAIDRIRAKALASGLATEAELATLSDDQIARFIFRAGLSTAEKVTAVSGRGVGMDVVRNNIERIGGTVDLKNKPGHGTTFTIKIPLTLAIVSALIVEAGKERFAIPQLSVVELVRARREADGTSESVIERINGTPVLRLRSRLLPLVSLSNLLALGSAAIDDDGAYIVVTQVGTNMLGIIVDRVFDTEEIVVKPVTPILRHVTMFSGNTILGDGSVIMILDPNGIARATGIGAGGETKPAPVTATEIGSSGEKTTMLLFRGNGDRKMAVPLGLIARLENIPRAKIEMSCGEPVTQYRGKLMPLVPISGLHDPDRDTQPVLVFADRDRAMGLMVDQIIDVVDDRLAIELGGARPGLLGTAVIRGEATDIIDTGYWLTQAARDWFDGAAPAGEDVRQRRILIVDDNAFFRQLLVPTLGAAGYQVTAAAGADEALRLRDAGRMFDAIVSDIDMPDMDGLTFVRTVRAGGPWADLPVVALTARAEPRDIDAGRAAGFSDYVTKSRRQDLTEALRTCLAEPALT